MEPLRQLQQWRSFLRQVHQGNSLLLLDYDGTLAPFKVDRMQAVPYPGVISRLETLASTPSIRTIIISGRSLNDLKQLLPLSIPLELWGSHGLERQLPSGEITSFSPSAEQKNVLAEAKEICQKYAPQGACELKPFAVALHWRGLTPNVKEESEKYILPKWEELCSHAAMGIHRFDGGLELRPKGFGKGDVVLHLLKEISDEIPVAYLGDDHTDEQAFKALGTRGLKVLVKDSPRETLADFRLVPPNELLQFLDEWIGG